MRNKRMVMDKSTPAMADPVPSQPIPPAPASESVAWFWRWDVLLSLSLLFLVGGLVGGWFASGDLARWALKRYFAQKIAEGYPPDQASFSRLHKETWLAWRNASPQLRNATVRLALYGAKVAEMEFSPGWFYGIPKPGETESELNLNFHPQEAFSFPKQSDILSGIHNNEDLTAQANFFAASFDVRDHIAEINVFPDDWKETTLPKLSRAELIAMLPGIQNRHLINRWRNLLGIDYHGSSKSPVDAYLGPQSSIFYLLRGIWLMQGNAERALEAWEHIGQKYPILPFWKENDVYLLNFAIRSGLFKESHLRRLLAAPYTRADDLRDDNVQRFREWIAMLNPVFQRSPKPRSKAKPMSYEMPNFAGLKVLLPWYESKKLSDPTLLKVFPRVLSLIHRAELMYRDEFIVRSEGLRGTSQWAEHKDFKDDFCLGKLMRNTRNITSLSYHVSSQELAPCNMLQALLGFGLYRARTGMVPQRLEDFMTPEITARLIQVPQASFRYTVDAKGIARLTYVMDATVPKHLDFLSDSGCFNPPDGIIVYNPADTPLKFPLDVDKAKKALKEKADKDAEGDEED